MVVNKLRLNVAKSKFMFFHMRQRRISQLHFYLNRSPIDYVTEFNFWGVTLCCNLNFKSHLIIIGTKRYIVIGLLHKLKYICVAAWQKRPEVGKKRIEFGIAC